MIITNGVQISGGVQIYDIPIVLTVVTDNLVLYYNPDDPASYPGSGTTINSLVSPNLTGWLCQIQDN
jgi:hypothetical protein